MISAADTIGVFQIESRAQMTMLPRLKPRCFYDLVIEVAIVRPGPIQGDMVHPYLRRRNGEEPVTYPKPEVKKVLGKTLGVPLFQEQAMSLAMVAAGFTPGEADQLRRAMAAWKRKGDLIATFETKFITGMLERGYQRDFAERCFQQIRGFSEYGFPESHAASFALIVYASAWLKKHHPAAFAAALINSQPMGFYAPAQIVRDAEEHGVEVRGVDVNHSAWDCTLEESRHEGTKAQRHEENAQSRDRWSRVTCPQDQPPPINHSAWDCTLEPKDEESERLRDEDVQNNCPPQHHSVSGSLCHSVSAPILRLGLRLVKGLRQNHGEAIARAVQIHGRFNSIMALWRASNVPVAALRTLARADAFQSMGLDRQSALWHIRKLRDDTLPLFEHLEPPADTNEQALPEVGALQQVVHDYGTLGLSLKDHPFSFLRDQLDAQHVTPAIELKDEKQWKQGRRIAVAGLALCRQRPATAAGLVFMTLEDETGVANIIVRPKVFEQCRAAARHGIAILAHGWVERLGDVVHIQARELHSLDDQLADLVTRPRNFH